MNINHWNTMMHCSLPVPVPPLHILKPLQGKLAKTLHCIIACSHTRSGGPRKWDVPSAEIICLKNPLPFVCQSFYTLISAHICSLQRICWCLTGSRAYLCSLPGYRNSPMGSHSERILSNSERHEGEQNEIASEIR